MNPKQILLETEQTTPHSIHIILQIIRENPIVSSLFLHPAITLKGSADPFVLEKDRNLFKQRIK